MCVAAVASLGSAYSQRGRDDVGPVWADSRAQLCSSLVNGRYWPVRSNKAGGSLIQVSPSMLAHIVRMWNALIISRIVYYSKVTKPPNNQRAKDMCVRPHLAQVKGSTSTTMLHPIDQGGDSYWPS